MHKKCKCKNAMQNKYKSKNCKFKNANCRKCFWTPAWFTFRGRAGYAVSVAWFSCIQVLEFASHAICARMSFSSVWVSVPASTLEWAHRFSGKGWWLAQPKSQTLLFGKAYRGPISLLFFAFLLPFFCFFVAFHLFIVFSNSICFALFLHFFQDVNILEQAQFDSTIVEIWWNMALVMPPTCLVTMNPSQPSFGKLLLQ